MELDPLFNAVAQEQDHLLSLSPRRAMVRRRLLADGFHASKSWRPTLLRIGLAATVLSACIAIAASLMAGNSRQLTAQFGTSRVPVGEGAWLNAPEESSVPLRFSDGSEIELSPRGRVRMIALHAKGAHLALESGGAAVAVTHGENRNWELRAGPFLVRVTGTKFDLAWDPNADSFDLSLIEGQVELVGCGFGSGRQLVAGQRVHASCRQNEVRIAYNQQDSGQLPAGATSIDRVVAASVHRDELESSSNRDVSNRDIHELSPKCDAVSAEAKIEPSVSEPSGKSPSAASKAPLKAESDWVVLARSGKYSDALRGVSQLGFSEQCARLRVDELALLSDTARHAGDASRARHAYTQLRQRFPGTKQASLAAFHLGLIEFDSFGAYAKAASWFRTYLSESPTGPLTREARGRLMEALHRTGNAEASGFASAYLRDYPSGPHAQLARRIVSSH